MDYVCVVSGGGGVGGVRRGGVGGGGSGLSALSIYKPNNMAKLKAVNSL